MKEQILYLDPHDDCHSMRDKIGWIQTDRVLLVVPPRRGSKRIFTRSLDLQLVQRHAAQLGAKLALVTDDPVITDYADGLGIQIFDKVDDSHLSPWRSRRPLPPARQRRPKPDPLVEAPLFTWPRLKILESPRVRLSARASLFFNLIAVVSIMLALTLPGAHITLSPHTQTLSATVPLTADPALTEIDFAKHLIPARTISTIVTGSVEVATTGNVDLATEKSGGYVTFTNLTNLQVLIPTGTAVRTTGGTPIRFVSQQDAVLEARKGATAQAFVLATNSGPRGNVVAGLINSIDGPLAVQSAVTNETATTGGEVKQVAAVTDDDRQRAKDQLLAQLHQQGYAQLLTQLEPSEFAPIDTAKVADIIDQTYDHFTGEKAERLKLDLRIEVTATAVDEQVAFQAGQVALNEQLGNTLAILPNTTTFQRNQTFTVTEEGLVQFGIVAQAQAGAIIDPEVVRTAAQWQLAEQTPDLLASQFPVIVQPQVEVWPNWFPRMPWLLWRIDVSLQPSGLTTP